MKKHDDIQNSDYFVIPNPIYDVVFKYLMEDNESAKIVLSTLINEKIKKLTFEPISHTEKIKDPKTEKELKLFHLDFSAIIEKPDGSEELIMIEIQKANRASDIFRFKRYISANFQRKQEKEIINPRTQAVERIHKPIRLIPIFILNFRIENEINDLLIKTNRIKTGVFKEKQLENNNEFIDNLSFDIWVIQLPNLNKIDSSYYENDEYKTKLYALLKLFDQEAQNQKNRHWLLLMKEIFPDFLERVIKRLKAANIDNPDLEDQMNAEDEYYTDKTADISKIEKNKESKKERRRQRAAKLNELTAKKRIHEKKVHKIEQQIEKLENEKRLREKKDKALNEKDSIIIELARTLKNNNITINIIKEKTGLSEEIIKKL